MRGKYEQPRSKGRGVLIAVLIVLIVLMVGLLAAVLYGSHLLGLINYAEDGYDGDQAHLEDAGLDVMRDEDVINILLIGQDARPGETQTRADTMILCSYHKGRKELTLTSFMRDMYVEIPGYYAHKMNSAHAWGGMKLVEHTLAVNFGIVVDGTFSVDFSSFQKVIDEIGGIDIELTAAEARYVNGNLYSEGVNHLSGADALTYARCRSIGNSDFDRTGRQQKVLDAIVQKCKGLSVLELTQMAESVLPMLSTNMKKGDIVKCMGTILPDASKIRIANKQRIPADDAFYYDTVSGMSVLVPDLEKNREILKSTIYGQ